MIIKVSQSIAGFDKSDFCEANLIIAQPDQGMSSILDITSSPVTWT